MSRVGFYGGSGEDGIGGDADGKGKDSGKGGFVGGGAVIGVKEKDAGKGKGKAKEGGSQGGEGGTGQFIEPKLQVETIEALTEALHQNEGKITGQNGKAARESVEMAVMDVHGVVEAESTETVERIIGIDASSGAIDALNDAGLEKGQIEISSATTHQQSNPSDEQHNLVDGDKFKSHREDASQPRKMATENDIEWEQGEGHEGPVRISQPEDEAGGQEEQKEDDSEVSPASLGASGNEVSPESGMLPSGIGAGGGAGHILGMMDMGAAFGGV